MSPDNGRFSGLHSLMDKNNVTAPEYYSNDPSETRDDVLLAPYMNRVADVFAAGTVEDLLELCPDAYVARGGNVVLYEDAPPMLDLWVHGGEVLLMGYYNEAVAEMYLGAAPSKFDALVDVLQERDDA